MPAKFVLSKDKAGKFRFNLVASNGQVVATSQGYGTRAAANNGINSVRKNAPIAAIDDQTVVAPPAPPAAAAAVEAPAAEPASAAKPAKKAKSAKKASPKSTSKSTSKKAAKKG